MEDQSVEVVGEVGQCQFGQCQFGLGAGQPASRRLPAIACRPMDGADEQGEAVLLMREDVFDAGTD